MKKISSIAIVLFQVFVMQPDFASAQGGDTPKTNLFPDKVTPARPPAPYRTNISTTPDISLPGFGALEIPPLDDRLRQPAPDTTKRMSIPVNLFDFYEPLPKSLSEINSMIKDEYAKRRKIAGYSGIVDLRGGWRLIDQIGLSIKTPSPASQMNYEPVMQSLYGREGTPASASLGSQNPYINHEEEQVGILVGIDPYTLKPIYIAPPGTKKKSNRTYKEPK